MNSFLFLFFNDIESIFSAHSPLSPLCNSAVVLASVMVLASIIVLAHIMALARVMFLVHVIISGRGMVLARVMMLACVILPTLCHWLSDKGMNPEVKYAQRVHRFLVKELQLLV